MKVKELIEKLQEFDQDKKVVRVGYDGGYENIYGVTAEIITDNFNGNREHAVVLD